MSTAPYPDGEGDAAGVHPLTIDALKRARGAAGGTAVLALLLLVSTLLVAAGLVLLTRQNRTIAEQKAVIEQQKLQLAIKADKLVRDVKRIDATTSPAARTQAIEQAQTQADVVEQQVSQDLPAGLIRKAPAEPASGAVLLTRGQATGWDIDIFWCEGSGQAKDYAIARAAADILASASSSKQVLAPGIWLGRIQIKSWPEKMREGTFKGLSVVSDGAAGEDAVQAALADLLQRKQATTYRRVHSVGPPTGSYLSVFACNGWRRV